MNKKNKLFFIAIDTKNIQLAKNIIKLTNTRKIPIAYKFGLEFLNSKNGRNFISKLKNKIIFADYKLNDIPTTMQKAVISIKDLKINYLTVHISSGLKALKSVRAVAGLTKIVGVTTLTSLDNNDLKQIGYNKKIKDLILHQVRLAKKANLDAIVCDGNSSKFVKKIFKKEIIVPGIRLDGDKVNDQKRFINPKMAFKNGATSIVIGRSITKNKIKNNLNRLIKSLEK